MPPRDPRPNVSDAMAATDRTAEAGDSRKRTRAKAPTTSVPEPRSEQAAKPSRAKASAKPSRAGTAGKRSRPSSAKAGEPGPCLVVGYDGSPESRHAASWAARRAAPNGRLVLVHATRPPHRWLLLALLEGAAEQVLRLATGNRDRGRALIDELFMEADESLLDITVEAHVVDRAPAEALIEAARAHHAREIVVGSHHSSRTGIVYGDVAAELTRSAPVPVCVVPLGEEPAGSGRASRARA